MQYWNIFPLAAKVRRPATLSCQGPGETGGHADSLMSRCVESDHETWRREYSTTGLRGLNPRQEAGDGLRLCYWYHDPCLPLFDCIKYLEDSNKLLADICRELPQPTPVVWVPVKTCSFVNSFVNRFLSFLPTYYLWYDPLEVIDWSGMWVGHHYQDQETLQPTLEGGEPPETEGGDWILFLLTFRRLMIFSYTSQLRATLCIPLHEIGMKIHFFFS